jgi:hypothetical protein
MRVLKFVGNFIFYLAIKGEQLWHLKMSVLRRCCSSSSSLGVHPVAVDLTQNKTKYIQCKHIH